MPNDEKPRTVPQRTVVYEYPPVLMMSGRICRARITNIPGGEPRLDLRWFEPGDGKGWGIGFSFRLDQVRNLREICDDFPKQVERIYLNKGESKHETR